MIGARLRGGAAEQAPRGKAKNTKSRRRSRVPAFGLLPQRIRRAGRVETIRVTQYSRWRLVTSRELRRAWRLTAAAALRLRSWVGFS